MSTETAELLANTLAYTLQRAHFHKPPYEYERAWQLEDGYSTERRIMSGRCSLQENIDFSMEEWDKQIHQDICLFKKQVKNFLRKRTNYGSVLPLFCI